jgi:hypothetical protein
VLLEAAGGLDELGRKLLLGGWVNGLTTGTVPQRLHQVSVERLQLGSQGSRALPGTEGAALV